MSQQTIMRKILLLFICVIAALGAKADDKNPLKYPAGKHAVYRIYLKDKKDTPYSLKKPSAYLSKRAIARRQQQHIQVDSTDLPVNPAYVKAIMSDDIQVLGCSKWNNTVVVMTNKEKKIEKLRTLPFVSNIIKVWDEPKNGNETAKRDSLRPMEREKESKDYYARADLPP